MCIECINIIVKAFSGLGEAEVAKAVTVHENFVILLEENLDGVRVKCYVLFCYYGNVGE